MSLEYVNGCSIDCQMIVIAVEWEVELAKS